MYTQGACGVPHDGAMDCVRAARAAYTAGLRLRAVYTTPARPARPRRNVPALARHSGRRARTGPAPAYRGSQTRAGRAHGVLGVLGGRVRGAFARARPRGSQTRAARPARLARPVDPGPAGGRAAGAGCEVDRSSACFHLFSISIGPARVVPCLACSESEGESE
jgi:hypothetical protein